MIDPVEAVWMTLGLCLLLVGITGAFMFWVSWAIKKREEDLAGMLKELRLFSIAMNDTQSGRIQSKYAEPMSDADAKKLMEVNEVRRAQLDRERETMDARKAGNKTRSERPRRKMVLGPSDSLPESPQTPTVLGQP